MNTKQILKKSILKLKAAGIESAALDAEIIIAFILKKTKEFIYTHDEKKLTPVQIKKINQLIRRRAKHTPLAYLIEQKEFYGLKFFVDKNVNTTDKTIDTPLVVKGAIMTSNKGRIFGQSRKVSNVLVPSEYIIFEPKYLIKFSWVFGRTSLMWKEVAP